MTSGGQFYRDKYKPSAIQYMEEHFHEYFEFMKNMTASYVNYTTSVTEKVAVYLEQTIPIVMNREQTLTTVATDADFIPTNSINGIMVDLIDADFANISRVSLLIIGRAVNTFAGQNNLNCAIAANNQWQWNINGGTYRDLTNMSAEGSKHDGQMLDTDWECMVQGAIHPFTFMFNMSGLLGALDDRVGLRLENARSRQNNLIVTVDVYMKIVWKL